MESQQITPPRRQFQLPENDEEFLNRQGLRWETAISGNHWLITHDFPLPEGYNHISVSVGLMINTAYPDGEIDMVYFHPHLSLASGKAIGALSPHAIDGQQWQRWSRHRTPQNPWRPGEDCIETHILLVKNWLERELKK